MKLKMIILLSSLCLPLAVNAAEITVTNNTNNFGTAKFGSGPCSSIAGDKGIAKPHQSMTIPQIVFDLFCNSETCVTEMYLSKNCNGKVLATATINGKSGIVGVRNHDTTHYDINYNQTNVIIDAKDA